MKLISLDDEPEDMRELVTDAARLLERRLHKAPTVSVEFIGPAEEPEAGLFLNKEDGSEVETHAHLKVGLPASASIMSLKNEADALFLVDVKWNEIFDYGFRLARHMVQAGIKRERLLLLTHYAPSAEPLLSRPDVPWFDVLSKTRFVGPEAAERLAWALYGPAVALETSRPRRVPTAETFGSFVGTSSAMREVYTNALLVAPYVDATVLISGESGTGKELLAKSLHECSRKDRPFVAINCGAIPETLIESELFGHEKGAFTGASAQRRGKFELAHGGTILLDEIADLPLHCQVKLLRVLQERSIERLGGAASIKLDVRVIAATNRDLEQQVRDGRFREDLFYRLNVVEFRLPSLRERKDDIPELVRHFIGEWCAKVGVDARTCSEDAMKVLQRYQWPGNVRQLFSIMERTLMFSPASRIEPQDLPPAVRDMGEGALGRSRTSSRPAGPRSNLRVAALALSPAVDRDNAASSYASPIVRPRSLSGVPDNTDGEARPDFSNWQSTQHWLQTRYSELPEMQAPKQRKREEAKGNNNNVKVFLRKILRQAAKEKAGGRSRSAAREFLIAVSAYGPHLVGSQKDGADFWTAALGFIATCDDGRLFLRESCLISDQTLDAIPTPTVESFERGLRSPHVGRVKAMLKEMMKSLWEDGAHARSSSKDSTNGG